MTPDHVRHVLKLRQLRFECIGPDLFADPAWDILLELYLRDLEQRHCSIRQLLRATSVPLTTGLRWLDRLDEQGLIARAGDPLDARCVWITLSTKGRAGIERYFHARFEQCGGESGA